MLATTMTLAAPPAAAQGKQPAGDTSAASKPRPAAPTSRPNATDAKRPDTSKLVRVRDVLRSAINHYQRSEFDKAKALLEKLLGWVGSDRTREAQEVHTYHAFVLIAFGQTSAAVDAFEKALAIRPDLSLGKTSPKIAAAFDSARRRYLAKVRALDHDPPRLRHEPRARVKHGAGLTVRVATDDLSPIKRVVLYHRVKGNRGFSAVTMERDSKARPAKPAALAKTAGAVARPTVARPTASSKPAASGKQAHTRWLASIPVLAVVRPGLEYYIEAWDVLGNGPGLKGSAARPISVEVVGGPLRPGGAGDVARPFYRKWWFWAIVASAVATAGAVGVGIYLGREERAGGTVIVPTQPAGR